MHAVSLAGGAAAAKMLLRLHKMLSKNKMLSKRRETI
jgi:hypothetical protein